MKIAKVNFTSQFLAYPFRKSEVLYESCDLAECVDFNAGTLSGLLDLLLNGLRMTAELSPSYLASFEIHSTIGEDDDFELNVRVVFNKEESIQRELHSRVFDGLRVALYSAADFVNREFSESYCDDTEKGGSK